MQPLVGVTLDYQEGGKYSSFPWYALCKNYVDVLLQRGCLVVPLPYSGQQLSAYLSQLDGVVISGGHFDVDPTLYGDKTQHKTTALKKNRTAFELTLVQEALLKKMPLLGICGGAQLLNVALGGTLIQHIPDAVPGALAHEQPNPRNEAGHLITIKEKTHLAKITDMKEVPVNSSHHQAIKEPGENVVVNAVASDGVIEGIELSDHPFCVGVQWHPEFLISKADEKLFTAFGAACAAYKEWMTDSAL